MCIGGMAGLPAASLAEVAYNAARNTIDIRGQDINGLEDIASNLNIASGDLVYLAQNPLECEDPVTLSDIAELELRGVSLFTDCD